MPLRATVVYLVTSSLQKLVRTGNLPFVPVCLLLYEERRFPMISPHSTVWLACTLSFILGLPSLGSSVAFAAATSIATIGLYISYGVYAVL